MNNLKKGQYIVRSDNRLEIFDNILKAKAKIANLIFSEGWAEMHEVVGVYEGAHGVRYDARGIVVYGDDGCGDDFRPYHFELFGGGQ